MRLSSAILPALLAPSALAVPSFRLPASPGELAAQAFDSAQTWIHDTVSHAKHEWDNLENGVEQGMKAEMVQMEGIEYLSLEHPAFPLHKLRVVKPELCDSKVNQLSGYLDISESKHLFFWFEESRHKPSKDPLVLWLNGGPGCSSTTGHLFELGACNIADEGRNITYNEHSWNSVANVIFLDQPVGVGFSYADNGEVNNSPAAAEDVVAFLSLFLIQFREYAKLDFHVAGESYAGTYIPNIADAINRHNIALGYAPTPSLPNINFKTVLIGDGLSDAYHQFPSIADWACNKAISPYAVYDDPEGPECTSLRNKAPTCQNLISGCYKTGSRFACVPAALYCWSMMSGLQDLGLNMYDARRKCDKSEDKDGPLCYREMKWMETYLNQPDIKRQLGAPASVDFQSCNMQINQKFMMQGDGFHNAAALLGPLIDTGLRVLIYAGETDMIVNAIGCAEVAENLQSRYTVEYNKAQVTNFTDVNGDVVGWTKATGKGAGNVAFVAFHNAGHMVPHDDPLGASAMFSRWLKNEPLGA